MDELPGGPLLAGRLDKAVREVCPIHGVSIGRRVDEAGAWARDTWRINPKPEATLEEIRAAYEVLASFDPNAEATPAPAEPHTFPANLSDKLSDWDTGADENNLTTADLSEEVDEFAGVYPAWLTDHAIEGEDMRNRIARLSKEFKSRVNELTNYLLAGTITKEQDDELIDKQAKYNALAELGDRS